jgi:hypothetical protein
VLKLVVLTKTKTETDGLPRQIVARGTFSGAGEKLYNSKMRDMCHSINFVTKPRFRHGEHEEGMRQMRNEFKIFIGNPENGRFISKI